MIPCHIPIIPNWVIVLVAVVTAALAFLLLPFQFEAY
jgi:hypothetical protein